MYFNSAFISMFLFVSAVLSSPLRREKDQPRLRSRVTLESTNGTSNETTSSLYSGAFWEESDGHFTFATATFNTLVLPAGQHGYTEWVGIDTITCNGSFLLAGMIAEVDYVWYQWGPEGAASSNRTVTYGDVFRASITALSTTSGAIIFENLNTSKSDVHYVNTTGPPLCERDVFWGVMPYGYKTFTFDTVSVTNAKAYGPSGVIYEAEGAKRLRFEYDEKVLTSVKTEGSTVTIQRDP